MKRLLVVFLVVLVSSLCAQDFGLYQVAPTVGVIFPEGDWNTGFQIGAKANVGSVMEDKIGLFPVVSYWSTKYDYDGMYADSDFELKLSNIKIGIDAHYDLGEYVENLYGGAGLAINMVKSEYPSVKYDDNWNYRVVTESDTDSEFGISFLAGYKLEVSGKPLFVEGRYDVISNLNTLGLKVGMFFDMKK